MITFFFIFESEILYYYKYIMELINLIMEVFKNNIEKLDRLTRRERLGELLIRFRLLNLAKLLDLMAEHRKDASCPFGEFLVQNSVITMQNLIELLNFQKTQDRVVDSCLEALGLMTNKQKWENITRHSKLGEVLVRQGKITLTQLMEAIEEQESTRPEKLLGDVLIQKGWINKLVLKNAIDEQQIQIQTLMKTIQELTNISQLPIAVKLRHMNTMWGSW